MRLKRQIYFKESEKPRLLNAKQVAERLGIPEKSYGKVYKLFSNGKIPVYEFNGKKVKESDLNDFINNLKPDEYKGFWS